MDATSPKSEIDCALGSLLSEQCQRERGEIPMTAPLLPFHAFLCVGAQRHHMRVRVDARYLAGRHAVLLPRFAMVGEHDEADVIGLEYGRPDEVREDLVIGTIEQLGRLRSLFQSSRVEEAKDADAVEFWDSLIRPLDAVIGSASSVVADPSIPFEGWFAWYSRREPFGSSPLE
jgi:hypothetical protein